MQAIADREGAKIKIAPWDYRYYAEKVRAAKYDLDQNAIKPYLPHRPDVRHVPLEEASKNMGTYAEALALDQVVRSRRARAIGWTPTLHSVSGNAARLLEEWRATRN